MYLRIKDIKKDQFFSENDCGCYAIFQALEDTRFDEENKQYLCRAQFISGDYPSLADEEGTLEFMEALDCGGYGLNLEAV